MLIDQETHLWYKDYQHKDSSQPFSIHQKQTIQMNETDIESSVVTSVVVDNNEEAATSIQSPNHENEESPKILFKVESSSKGDVVKFISKQDAQFLSL